MEARVLLRPKFTGTVWQEELDITDMVTGGIRLSQKADKNDWSYGVVSSGSLEMEVIDPEGRFDLPQNPNSVFSAYGMDGAEVRVEYATSRGGSEYVTVWSGVTTSKEGRRHPAEGVSHIYARTADAVLREVVVAGGVLVENQTLRGMAEAMFRDREILRVVQGGLDYELQGPGVGVVLRNPGELLGDDRQLLDALEKLLQISDGLLTFDFAQGKLIMFTRGLLNRPAVQLDSIHNWTVSAPGAEQVFNEFVFETGLEGENETVTVKSDGSIHTYGLRSVEIGAEWLGDAGACAGIGRYLLTRLARPRRQVQVQVTAWQVPPDKVLVGQELIMNIPPESVTAGSGEYGRAGGVYAQLRAPRLQGRFWIEEVQRDIEADLVTLSLREVL